MDSLTKTAKELVVKTLDKRFSISRNNPIPNFASLVPTSIWPGTEGKHEVTTRNEAIFGRLEC